MNMKKLISMVLALVMLLAMSATVFAAENTPHTITITDTKANHIYEAYKVFAGELSDGNLIDVEWGNGVKADDLLAALQADKDVGALFADAETAADVAAVLSAEDFTTANLEIVAQLINDNLTTNATRSTEKGSPYTINVSGDGYYLIKDQENSLDPNVKDDAYTKVILKVVNSITINVKKSVPTVVKKVQDANDTNDTSETVNDWQDSADHDIGDHVPFQLTATLANNVSAYDTYKVVFHDTLSAGLDYDENSAKVYLGVGGTEVTTYFSINENNGTLTISCDNVKAFGATDSSVIVVEYTATLDKDAVIGSEGNPNTVYLEYSNNPNGTGTGRTEDDKVIVFTYKVIVNKVDQDMKKLNGAEFTLIKKLANGSELEIGKVAGTDGDVFMWEGLDDGDYVLTETAPEGYNSIEPIEFTITADHDIESNDPRLNALNGGDLVSGEFKDTGVITTSIVNQKGAELPETGAQGTKMIYIVGGILVAAAAVLLITKRRMDSAE